MVASKKIINIFAVLFCFWNLSAVYAKPNTNIVAHRWVVKIKQNSFFNQRPIQFASPVFQNGKLFVGSQQGVFYGIDAQHGKKIWKLRAEGSIDAPAATEEGAVYFGDRKGIVYALDQNSGKPIWMTKVGGPIASAPLVVGDKLYVISLLKELTCLDLKEGKIVWQESFGNHESGFTIEGAADPVLFDSLILIGYSDGNLVAHRVADGSVAWSKQLGDRFSEFHDVDSTPFLVSDSQGSTAYVSSADGKIFALNPQNGALRWSGEGGGINSPFVSDSLLYITQRGKLSCFEAKTGTILWEQDLGVPELSSPVVYKNWVVTAATKGKIYFLDKKNGDVVYSWYVRGGSFGRPLLIDNYIYLLSNAGRLYAFQFKS